MPQIPMARRPLRLLRTAILGASFLAAPVLAGETVVYAPEPAWVRPPDMAAALASDGPAQRLLDWQQRIEASVVHLHFQRAVRIETPQALMQENTLSFPWSPDKGDLTVHRLEVHRGGEVIDLLAQGSRFEVIRREEGLERGLLDGQLTATLSVPGLQVGDVLRYAVTISIDDQALGDEVQATQFLPSAPWQVGTARALISWPVGEEMYWRAESRVNLGDPVEADGYRWLEVPLPLAQPAPMPEDAPARFRRGAVLRVGSFASWAELSQVMHPHFAAAASIAPDSPVAAQAREIMARTADPLERAALATQVVQDEVSYLLNGLDGGNYLPQTADETWEKRYGDCKAKSVLLLGLLREMGIDAEVVLVSSQGGDGVPELLPLPAAFDHMIVRAQIGGQEYWLDGTSAATRLANLADVPPFFHALPLRPEGSELVPMVPRAPALPGLAFDIAADHSAGVDFPQLITLEMTLTGPGAAQLRPLAGEDDPDRLRQLASNVNLDGYDNLLIGRIAVAYDEAAATARISAEGVAASGFEWVDGRLRNSVMDLSGLAEFNPDRARPAWRDIPLQTEGPARTRTRTRMTLPDGGRGFALEGTPELDAQLAGSRLLASSRIDGAVLDTVTEEIHVPIEVAAADLPAARREARRLAALNTVLRPPADAPWRWQLEPAERRTRAAPILAAYDAAIAFADKEDFGPLQTRALFNASIFEFAAARADFDRLIAASPSAWAYQQRANLHQALGAEDAALADLNSAWELDPSNTIAFEIARLQAYEGDPAGAQALLAQLPVGEEEAVSFADALATVTGLDGDVAGGLQLIAARLDETPNNADVLNSDCWYRGLFNTALEDALARCTQAVERAEDPAYALDSRALVRFRQGDAAGALADLDAALDLAPGLAPSLYLRGVVRLQTGDRSGREDIATALRMMPQLPRTYGRHGIVPPR